MPEKESGGQRYGLGAVHFPPSLLSMWSLSVTQFFFNLFVLATTTSQSLRCLRPSQELGAFLAHTNLSKVNESHEVTQCNTFVVFIFFYFSTLLITFLLLLIA